MNNRSRPKLGQHFLTDDSVVASIIELANLPTDATVVEIGPGTGILSRALTAALPDGQLLAIEVDGTLAFNLRERVSKKVKVIHADAIRFDYTTVATPYQVVSNLPYQITSPILRTLIGSANPPETMTMMMQREVADRLLALPHTRERGLLTIVVEWYGSVTKGFDVGPESFTPPPKVWSTVVRLTRWYIEPETRRVTGSIKRPDFQPFVNFLKIGFSEKRRQIHHPLATRFPMFKADLDTILAVAGVERTQRAEELSFEQWVKLFDEVMKRLQLIHH